MKDHLHLMKLFWFVKFMLQNILTILMQNPSNKFKMIIMASVKRLCLDWKCQYRNGVYSERIFFYKHVLRKTREHVLSIVKHYDLIERPEFENYYRVLNIFVDNCKESTAKELMGKFD